MQVSLAVSSAPGNGRKNTGHDPRKVGVRKGHGVPFLIRALTGFIASTSIQCKPEIRKNPCTRVCLSVCV